MKVILYAPGKKRRLVEVPNTLPTLQATVGGYIETLRLTDELVLVCDEEGKLKGKPATAYLFDRNGRRYDCVVGTFFVCRIRSEKFVSADFADMGTTAPYIKQIIC